MTWFKVDDGLSFHSKTMEAGNAAMGAWVRMGSYSAQHELDGRVPQRIAQTIGKPTELQALMRAGLLTRDGLGDYVLHDFLVYNPSREQLQKDRKSWAEKKHRQRKPSPVVSPRDTPGDSPENPPETPTGSPGRVGSGSDPDPEGSAEGRPAESLREACRRGYSEGIRTVIDGPPFHMLDEEVEIIVSVLRDTPKWCGLRGPMAATAIRKSAHDYALARKDKAQFEKGFAPQKWAEWLRGGGVSEAKPSAPQHKEFTFGPGELERARPIAFAIDSAQQAKFAATIAQLGQGPQQPRQPMTELELADKARLDKQRLLEAEKKAGGT